MIRLSLVGKLVFVTSHYQGTHSKYSVRSHSLKQDPIVRVPKHACAMQFCFYMPQVIGVQHDTWDVIATSLRPFGSFVAHVSYEVNVGCLLKYRWILLVSYVTIL